MQWTQSIDEYAAGPAQVARAVAGMTAQQLRARPVAGKWSTLEVVCHLADFEIVYADRLKRVLAENEPPLRGGDPSQFAAHLAYEARDLDEELAVIDATRKQLARILRTLHPEDFERRGIHSEAGPITLGQLLERITGHVPHHLRFIQEKRKALGL